MKKFLILTNIFLINFICFAQIPSNYFNEATGLTGPALKQKLHDIITTGHVKLSYSALWDAYYTTDVYPSPQNTKVWDVYSGDAASNSSYSGTAPYYLIIGTDQDNGSGGSNEGEKYNREHTIPNSWWGGAEEYQYTDLHCLFATDKKVNNQRGNHPYGEVSNPSWTSLNGGKLGSNNVSGSGYTGIVFEPIDAFKGDLARAYFYFAVRYKDEISGWVSNYSNTTDIDVVFNSSGNFNTWYYDMLYSWHVSDPPSNKEILRNNAIYNTNQKNANPFVAHPEWVCMAFSSNCNNDIKDNVTNISVYPNPTTDFVSLKLSNFEKTTVYITNLNGQILLKQELNAYESTFDLTNFTTGIYILKIENPDFINYSKIIKN